MSRFAALIADLFSRWVASRSEEQLDRIMRGPLRRPLIAAVFRAMPPMLRRRKAAGVETAIELRVSGRRGGGEDRGQLVVTDGRCRLRRRRLVTPVVIATFQPAAFLQFVGGVATAPELFLGGRVKLEGGLMPALQLTRLFRFPRPEANAADAAA